MLHTFSVYVHERPHVLNRVASVFHQRGFSIESLTIGPSERRGISRMTLGVNLGEERSEQVEAKLHRLVDVILVEKMNDAAAIVHELALIKICVARDLKVSLPEELVRGFHARVVARGPGSLILEAAGTSEQIDVLVQMLRPCVILELVRTGRIAMAVETKRAPCPTGSWGSAPA